MKTTSPARYSDCKKFLFWGTKALLLNILRKNIFFGPTAHVCTTPCSKCCVAFHVCTTACFEHFCSTAACLLFEQKRKKSNFTTF